MIKHIVMWNFEEEAEGQSKEKNINTVVDKLQSLNGSIPGLDSMETGKDVGKTPASCDLVLITTHPDKNGLITYRDHPDHQEVAGFIKKVTNHRQVVDFEY